MSSSILNVMTIFILKRRARINAADRMTVENRKAEEEV